MPNSPANETAPVTMRTSRTPRLVAVGAVVVVGGLAVGVASRPHRVDVAPSLPNLDVLFVPLLLGVAGLTGLLLGHNFIAAWARGPEQAADDRRKSKVPRLVQTLVPIAVLGIVALVRLLVGAQHGNGSPLGMADTAPISVNAAASGGGDVALVFGCAAIGLVAAVAATLLRRSHPAYVDAPMPHPGVAAILDEGLSALADESDPRRAVIAAYVAMERAMARQGWARRPAEAPTEYLARVLGVAPARAGDLDRLVGLYQLARFSEHEVTPAMRDEATSSVRRLRADLEATA